MKTQSTDKEIQDSIYELVHSDYEWQIFINSCAERNDFSCFMDMQNVCIDPIPFGVASKYFHNYSFMLEFK